MALSLIGVGTTANDGTGDPLRTAFQTVNTALTLLDDFASAANTDGNIMVGTGTGWAAESGATARTSLGLGIGDDVEHLSLSVDSVGGVYNFMGYATHHQTAIPTNLSGNDFLITGGFNSNLVLAPMGNSVGEGLKIGILSSPLGTPAFTQHFVFESATGRFGANVDDPDYLAHINGTFGFAPGASVTPVNIGDIVFEATSNTTFTVKLKGSDGVVRSGTITLS
jgi:hypothetical protein